MVTRAAARRKWLMRFVASSMALRKGRVAVASVSVAVLAAIVVCSMGISLGIRQKLGEELKAYGANVLVTPGEGYLSEGDVRAVLGVPGVSAATPQLYARAGARGGHTVELMGLDMDGLRETGWNIEGAWPSLDTEVILGADASRILGLGPGDSIALDIGGGMEFSVSGVVERGGPEDTSVILPIGTLRRALGLGEVASALFVRAASGTIETTVAELAGRLPGARVKTLRQVAYAEEELLRKMELLLYLVSLVVLAATGISVSSTMTATVLERLKEIGLMKAIGGTSREIAVFYLVEGGLIGLVGGAAGYIIGYAAAQAVSRGAFGSFVDVPWVLLPGAMGLGLAVAIISSLGPMSNVLRVRAANMLRDE